MRKRGRKAVLPASSRKSWPRRRWLPCWASCCVPMARPGRSALWSACAIASSPANSTPSSRFIDLAHLRAADAVASGGFCPILPPQAAERNVTQRHSDRGEFFSRLAVIGAGLIVAAGLLQSPPALALSEIQREDVPLPPEDDTLGDDIERGKLPPPEMQPEPGSEEPVLRAPGMNVPFPDPVVIPKTPARDDAPVRSGQDDDIPVPDVVYDVDTLPEPVQRMRALIMEACLSGDIEQLRPLIEVGESGTQLSLGNVGDDPVEFLRELSGDDQGQE